MQGQRRSCHKRARARTWLPLWGSWRAAPERVLPARRPLRPFGAPPPEGEARGVCRCRGEGAPVTNALALELGSPFGGAGAQRLRGNSRAVPSPPLRGTSPRGGGKRSESAQGRRRFCHKRARAQTWLPLWGSWRAAPERGHPGALSAPSGHLLQRGRQEESAGAGAHEVLSQTLSRSNLAPPLGELARSA